MRKLFSLIRAAVLIWLAVIVLALFACGEPDQAPAPDECADWIHEVEWQLKREGDPLRLAAVRHQMQIACN